MCRMNEFGAPQMCDVGCLELCDECNEELHSGANKMYVGSGEDAPIAARKVYYAKKEEALAL